MSARPYPLELRLFYAIFLTFLIARVEVMLTRGFPLSEEKFVGLASVLAGLGRDSVAVYPLVVVGMLLAFALCLWRPQWRSFRIGAFLSANLLLSLYFSVNGSTWNTYHGFVTTALILCFLNGKANWDFQVFRFAQAAVLTHYALSGWWKVSSYFSADSITFSGFFMAPFNALAAAVGEGFGPNKAVLNLTIEYPWLVSLGWLGVLVFQCGAFLPLLRPQLLRVWGIGAILFHLGTGFFLDIWFPESIALDLFLFVLYEDWIALGNYPNVKTENA
jgi:hypothetical protein